MFLSVWYTFIMKNDSELRIIIRTRLSIFFNHALAYHKSLVVPFVASKQCMAVLVSAEPLVSQATFGGLIGCNFYNRILHLRHSSHEAPLLLTKQRILTLRKLKNSLHKLTVPKEHATHFVTSDLFR